MKYIFENENALELYYVITKEMGIKLTFNLSPGQDHIYLSENFLTENLEFLWKKTAEKESLN